MRQKSELSLNTHESNNFCFISKNVLNYLFIFFSLNTTPKKQYFEITNESDGKLGKGS